MRTATKNRTKKILFGLLIIFFFFIVPLFSIQDNYEIFQVYLHGKVSKSTVLKKEGECYSRSSANSVFVNIENQTIKIHISNAACKKIAVGDSISLKTIPNSNIGLYMQDNGIYPFSIFGNILAILLGIFFIIKINKIDI